jgi:hypothetical protein
MGFGDGALRALAYFMGALWILAMYRVGLIIRKECRSRLKVLAIILAVTCTLTYMSWSRVGTHNEDGNDDPLFGLDETVQDYVPSTAQRNRAASTILLLTFLPMAAGGLRKDVARSETKPHSTLLT